MGKLKKKRTHRNRTGLCLAEAGVRGGKGAKEVKRHKHPVIRQVSPGYVTHQYGDGI